MVKVWLMAVRPKTLGAALAPVLLGTAMANPYVQISYPLFILILVTATLLQIGSNLVNDYYDHKHGADTKDRKGPTRVMSANLVTVPQMKTAIQIVFGLALLGGGVLAWVGGLPIITIGIASILCAISYTAGPYPLAYLGLGDLFVFIFFGPVAVMGTFYLQTKTWGTLPFLLSIPLGFLTVAILTVNNVRDVHEDKKSDKKTVVVRFGEVFGKAQYTVCILIPFVLSIVYFYSGLSPRSTLLALGLFVFAIPMLKVIWTFNDRAQLNSLLSHTAQFLILFSIVNSIAWFYNG